MKKTLRLTESDLHRIVKESVNRILNEVADDTTSIANIYKNVRAQKGVTPNSYGIFDNGYNTRDLSPAQMRKKQKLGDEEWINSRRSFMGDLKRKHDSLVSGNIEKAASLAHILKDKFKGEDVIVSSPLDDYDGIFIEISDGNEQALQSVSSFVNEHGFSLRRTGKANIDGMDYISYVATPIKNKQTIG